LQAEVAKALGYRLVVQRLELFGVRTDARRKYNETEGKA